MSWRTEKDNENMRVLIVASWWPTSDSPRSAPFMVHDTALLQKDHEVIVLYLCAPQQMGQKVVSPPNIRVTKVPYNQFCPTTWLGAAHKIRWASVGADLVHTMAINALIPTWLARIQVPWVHTEHYSTLVTDKVTLRQRFSLGFVKKLFAKPDAVVAVGETLAQVIGCERRDMPLVIGNYVETETEVTREPGDELGVGKPIRMIAVGILIDRKGPLETLSALVELRRRGHDVTLAWAGTGPLKEVFQEKVEEYGVENYVELLGSVDFDVLKNCLRKSNVFVLPTEAETFGVAMAEALGHGLPIVTSGTGGHLEFLPPGGSRVVKERTGVNLANAVESLMLDAERMRSRELIAYATEHFSDKVRRQRYADAYRLALKRGRQKSGKDFSGAVLNECDLLQAQIVIPVHDTSRPLRRSVDSVLRCKDAGAIVVAHGIAVADLDLPENDRLSVVEVSNGVGFPGVAFNAGLNVATSPWVGIMGSDDWYQDGAIESMLSRVAKNGGNGILAPLRHAGVGKNSLKPVTWRRTKLRADRDRLFFRTAPLGLFNKSLLQDRRYQMAEHVVAGVDQLSGVRLWTDGLNVSYYPNDPAYVVGDDAPQRVTLMPRPLSTQCAMWSEVWEDAGVLALSGPMKQVLADKMIRVHIFDMIGTRIGTSGWEQDFMWLSGLANKIVGVVPGCALGLNRTQTQVFVSLLNADRAALERTWFEYVKNRESFPTSLKGMFHLNGCLRTKMVAALNEVRTLFELKTESCGVNVDGG